MRDLNEWKKMDVYGLEDFNTGKMGKTPETDP